MVQASICEVILKVKQKHGNYSGVLMQKHMVLPWKEKSDSNLIKQAASLMGLQKEKQGDQKKPQQMFSATKG